MSIGSSTSSFKPAPQPVPVMLPEPPAKLIPTKVTVLTNWRSTISGILSAVVAAGVYFAAVPTTQLQGIGITQKEVMIGTVVVGLAKVYLAMITKDAK
jgi:hypothetical protein